MSDGFNVAQVVMPEKGMFLVRCNRDLPPVNSQVLVSLDYGDDMGIVSEVDQFDPQKHGDRIPGFQMVRMRDPEDDAIIAQNEKLATAMRSTFLKSALTVVSDIRIPYARLSFGRTRLFIRYVSSTMHADLIKPISELKRLFGVSVNAWQLGPRDEVSVMGALGPCGRACCCATWQKRYPTHLSSCRTRNDNVAHVNGVCGRFKCCLAFDKQ